MTKWNQWQVIILSIAFCLFAGCSSQSNNGDSSLSQTSVRDLHTVNFHFEDQNKKPIDHALVSAVDNSTSNPLKDYTNENGNLSFVMRGSVQYNITVSNLRDGQSRSTLLFPTDSEYLWAITPIPTPTPKPDPNAKLAKDIQNLNDGANAVANGITNTVNFVTRFL